MSLRIAFDLDGTLADLDAALGTLADGPSSRFEAEAQPPEAAPLSPEEEQVEPARVRALSPRQQRELWKRVRATENFWESLAETEPGIVARIQTAADALRWEVIFITQRPRVAGDTTQRQTQRWLARHGFEWPSVFVLDAGASRGKLASALSLDVVVDDRSENCLDVKLESGARAFLVYRGDSSEIVPNAKRVGVEAVPSVGEMLDLLSDRGEKPGLLGRIRKMMGT